MRGSYLIGLIGLASLALATSAAAAPAASSNPCDPLTYGAVADGTIGTNNGTDNTNAIQSAINACAAAGGGVVSLGVMNGQGVYLTGPILLQSHVLLQLKAGVTLLATTDEGRYHIAYLDYPAPGTGAYPFQPTQPYEALVFAYQAVDTGIIGSGTIDGQGNVVAPNTNRPAGSGSYLTGGPYEWWNLPTPGNGASVNGTTWYNAPYTDIPTSNGTPRPWLVEFYECNNVTISGITLTDSPMWTLVLRYSSNINISNYHVQNYKDGALTQPAGTGPNTDGIDYVGSSNVTISNITVQNGDDDIAIKSGLPLDVVSGVQGPPGSDPNEVGLPTLPTHDTTIANTTFPGGDGISVGSEASNGVYNVSIANVRSTGTTVGFRIKTGRTRGSYAVGDHNITVQNMNLVDVPTPITMYGYYPASDGPDETEATTQCTLTVTKNCIDPPQQIQQYTPNVYDITITNLTATGTTGQSLVVGVPESCILDVNLNNVNITTSTGGSAGATGAFQLRNMTGTFTNVNVTSSASSPVPPFVVQENVQLTAVHTPGLTSPINTPPLTTTPPGAPCGRYALGSTP
jgi:polygalacturonase